MDDYPPPRQFIVTIHLCCLATLFLPEIPFRSSVLFDRKLRNTGFYPDFACAQITTKECMKKNHEAAFSVKAASCSHCWSKKESWGLGGGFSFNFISLQALMRALVELS